MPSPITMTPHMIEESFADLRERFEEFFSKAKESAEKGSKLAKGNFKFDYPGLEWTWKNNKERAKLTIEPTAYTKMVMLMFDTDKEIGWHGLIERDPEDEKHFILQDIILFPQEVTSVTVVADEEKYPMWALTLPEEQFKKLRFHGHSHVNMGVTPSSTDTTYYEQNIKQFSDGFYVFMIINKRFETFIQLYDFDHNTFYDKNEVDIEIGNDFARELSEAKKSLVSTRTYQYQTPSYGASGGYYGGGYQSRDYLYNHNYGKGDEKKGKTKNDRDEKEKEIDDIAKDIRRKSDEDIEKELFGDYETDEHPWYQD